MTEFSDCGQVMVVVVCWVDHAEDGDTRTVTEEFPDRSQVMVVVLCAPQETEKGQFAKTDEYQAHLVVSRDGRSVLLVTDKWVQSTALYSTTAKFVYHTIFFFFFFLIHEKECKINVELEVKAAHFPRLFGTKPTGENVSETKDSLGYVLYKVSTH